MDRKTDDKEAVDRINLAIIDCSLYAGSTERSLIAYVQILNIGLSKRSRRFYNPY